jgi:carbamoyl-phosphate synthase large subunit
VALAGALNVVGLMNIQFAVVQEEVYILEANPRASRTVPFVSKAIGQPLAKLASLLMAGQTLDQVGLREEIIPGQMSVKEAVLPFEKFPGSDTLLGPEMRSTGEVMGIDSTFARAFAKSQIGAGVRLPLSGCVFVSLSDRHKEEIVPVVAQLMELGFGVMATEGTRLALLQGGLENVERVYKLHEGRPHVLDEIKNGRIQLIVNTPSGEEAQADGQLLRRSALTYKLPIITTVAGARATVEAIRSLRESELEVKALQDYVQEGS